jgi:hypothetical protein
MAKKAAAKQMANVLANVNGQTQNKKQSKQSKSDKSCKNCVEAKRKCAKTHDFNDCYWPGGPKESEAPDHIKNLVAKSAKTEPTTTEQDKSKLFGAITSGPSLNLLNSYQSTRAKFIIDSGASFSCTYQPELLYDVEILTIAHQAVTADGHTSEANIKGKLRVKLPTGELGEIHNVYLYTNLERNLLSVSAMDESGLNITFAKNKCLVSNNNQPIMTAHLTHEGLYEVNNSLIPNLSTTKSAILAVSKAKDVPSRDLMHKRLGHLNHEIIDKLAESTINAKFNMDDPIKFCDACTTGKMTALPYKKKTSKQVLEGTGLGELNVDTAGPFKTKTPDGYRYFLAMVLRNTTKYVAVSLMTEKSEAPDLVIEFVKSMERKTGKKFTSIRCDGAKEYQKLSKFCQETGIELHNTNPYAHNQNATIERNIRTIQNMASAMLQDANLPHRYWGYAVCQAAYIKNRAPMKILEYRTPYELTLGTKPDLQYLRRFGSRCFVHIPQEKQVKLGPRSNEGIFLGNTENGYIVKINSTGKITYSRDVIFDETYEPAQTINSESFFDSGSEAEDEELSDNNSTYDLSSDSGSDDSENYQEHEQQQPSPQPAANQKSPQVPSRQQPARASKSKTNQQINLD